MPVSVTPRPRLIDERGSGGRSEVGDGEHRPQDFVETLWVSEDPGGLGTVTDHG